MLEWLLLILILLLSASIAWCFLEIRKLSRILFDLREVVENQGAIRELGTPIVDSNGRVISVSLKVNAKGLPKQEDRVEMECSPKGFREFKNVRIKDNWHVKERGHLLGYQLSGINSTTENLNEDFFVTMTSYLNRGELPNRELQPNAMQKFENDLKKWVEEHEEYVLDYVVEVQYRENEIIPRFIKLKYKANHFETNEEKKVQVGRYEKEEEGYTTVLLENWMKNYWLDYRTGEVTQLESHNELNTLLFEAMQKQSLCKQKDCNGRLVYDIERIKDESSKVKLYESCMKCSSNLYQKDLKLKLFAS